MFKHSFSYYFRNTWEFIRWDIPRFFKNIWRFRRELKSFGGWDRYYTISMLRRSLITQKESMEKFSNEYEPTLRLKLYYMKRAIYLTDCILEDKFHDMAEARLGYKTVFRDFKFEPIEGSTSKRLVFDEESEEERQANWKIFEESSKIEKEVWNELFDILKGDIYNVDMYTEHKGKAYEDVHNGKGLINWWY
jgi:hypothetical protein